MQPEIPPPPPSCARGGDIKQFHRGEEVATNIFPLDNTFFITGLISISCYATRLLEWPYSYSVWRNLPPHLLIRSLGTLYTLLILVERRVLYPLIKFSVPWRHLTVEALRPRFSPRFMQPWKKRGHCTQAHLPPKKKFSDDFCR